MKKNLVVKLLGMLLAVSLVISSFPSGMVSADPQEGGNDDTEVYYGDVNDDGKVDAKDVTTLRRSLAGGWNVTINEEKADVSADGKVDAKDVTVLRRYLAGGWGVTLPPKPVLEPRPVAVEQSSLSSLKLVFDMPVSPVNPENIAAYYMDGDEKAYLNIMNAVIDNIYPMNATVNCSSQIPQGKTIYVEYCGKEAGSFKSVVVTENSVSAILVPDMAIIAGQESRIRYTLLDQNGVDITSAIGTILNGVISTELKGAPIAAYVSGLKVYCQNPNETFKVAVRYTWLNNDGVQKWIEGQGTIVCIPEEPWQLSGVMGVITQESDEDFVSSDHRSFNYYGDKITPLTVESVNPVIQIGVSYSRKGEMWIDTKDSVRGLNLASYPDKKVYTAYELRSVDERIVMIGSYTGNKVGLLLNRDGSTIIIVYGVMANGDKEIIGTIPVVVKPRPNPLLNDPGEDYVYNNITDSEIRITASDSGNLVTADGKINSSLNDAECCIDTPDANVIQIAVPYTNIDGTVYAGLEKAPLSTEFSEYVFESSDNNVIELGEVISGKLKFTCKDIGWATITLYGKASDGTKTLLATKEVKVSRSKINSPKAQSVKQVSLDTVEITFDRDVTNEKLWTGEFARYFILTEVGTKLYDLNVQSVTVNGKKALVRFVSHFTQDKDYFIDFNGETIGEFRSAKISADSVASIVIDPKKIQPGEFSTIDYHLYSSDGVDITESLNGTLNGFIYFTVKEQARYQSALLDGEKIYLSENDSACTVEATYSWFDGTGNAKQVKGEAIFCTGEGTLLPSVGSYCQGSYPAGAVRLEAYVYRGSSVPQDDIMDKKINAAYADDSMNILVKAFDQFGECVDGLPISVEKNAVGNVGYSGTEMMITGQSYVLKASDISGSGVLNLKLVYGDGNGELTKVLPLQVGNDLTAVSYVPVISNTKLDTSFTENSVQDSITVSIEGRAKGGYRTAGVDVRFTESTPRAGDEATGTYPVRVYTVSKDGSVLNHANLPTLEGNTFFNVKESNGYAVKMAPGTYRLNFYEIRSVNGRQVLWFLGVSGFTVEDSQPKLIIQANANINKLPEITNESLKQAFDITFDGAAVNTEDLLFDYTVNGTGDIAYVKSVTYTVRNKNGLGNLNLYNAIDVLAKTSAGPGYPIAEHDETLTDWEMGTGTCIVTDEYAEDYVKDGDINPECKGINFLSMDYNSHAFLQIAVPFTKGGTTVVEAPGSISVSGYTDYYLRSNNESVVMLGERSSENKIRLNFNNPGATTISIYGVRADGYMEFVTDVDIEIVEARKISTFTVMTNKNQINLAYAADYAEFNVVVKDQYGDIVTGQALYIAKNVNGQNTVIRTENASGVVRLTSVDLANCGITSSGVLRLVFSLGNGMQYQTTITVGNEAAATNYVLSLSNIGMSIANPDPYRQQAVYVYSQGKAKGFDLPGVPLYFTETTPSTSSDSISNEIRSQLDANGTLYVFTVKKDDEIQKAGDLPTFSGNAFYNCIQDADGNIITMNPGEYTVTVFQIRANGESLIVTLEGSQVFTVTG